MSNLTKRLLELDSFNATPMDPATFVEASERVKKAYTLSQYAQALAGGSLEIKEKDPIYIINKSKVLSKEILSILLAVQKVEPMKDIASIKPEPADKLCNALFDLFDSGYVSEEMREACRGALKMSIEYCSPEVNARVSSGLVFDEL